MSSPTWLIDKSALVRLGISPAIEVWANRIERGLVHISTVTLLEIGYSARTADDLSRARHSPPLSAMPVEYSTPAIEDRALDVQSRLAQLKQHRAASIADLLIAATAEITHRVVLHRDKDFELIADLTGQPLERLTT